MTSYRDAEMEAQAEFHAHEMDVDGPGDLSPNKMLSPKQRTFEGWLAEVSRITGIENLDGDNSETAKAAGTASGYSLDECFEWFTEGLSPQRAANYINDPDGSAEAAAITRAERNFGC